jgi:tripartite ATP-independent transporter DctP family solute receptor
MSQFYDMTGLVKRSLVAWLLASLSCIAAANDAVEISLAHVTSDKEPIQDTMESFAAAVLARSGGQIRITVFANGALGNNPEVYEQVRAGAPMITISDPGYLSDFVADFGVLGGPYLIDHPEDFDRLLQSDLFAELSQRLRDESQIELLALNWLFGSRHMISDRPISRPPDLEGMTFRTPPNIMWVETFRALGARPAQLAFPEVYSGLSTGVVDGAESPLPTLYAARLYEVRKVLSLTGHFQGFTGLVMGTRFFERLPEEWRIILKEEALAAGHRMTERMLRSEAEWVARFEAQGVRIHRDIDIDAFRQASAVVYERFPRWTPGLHARVRQILDKP